MWSAIKEQKKKTRKKYFDFIHIQLVNLIVENLVPLNICAIDI